MDARFTSPTLALVNDLNRQGIERMSLVIRHSARQYSNEVSMEPFMCLTEQGRGMALSMGAELPDNFSLSFFSSYIGRCIETAYLIDKGFIKKSCGITRENRVCDPLSPFYVKNIKKLIPIILEQDAFTFIRNWIDGNIPEDILMNAGEAAEIMLNFIAGGLMESGKNTLHVSVTHDWNMYLIKEIGLALPHETYGKIEYLEGVVLFIKDEKLFIANHQKNPESLSLKT